MNKLGKTANFCYSYVTLVQNCVVLLVYEHTEDILSNATLRLSSYETTKFRFSV